MRTLIFLNFLFLLFCESVFAQHKTLDSLKRHYQIYSINSDSSLAVVDLSRKVAILDRKNQFLTDYIYDYVTYLGDDLWKVRQNDKVAFMDKNAHLLTDFVFYDIKELTENRFASSNNNKFALLGNKFQVLSDFKWDFISEFHQNFAIVKKEGKYGIIDTSANEVVACQYSNIEFDKDGYVCTQSGKKSFLNTKLQTVFPAEYEDIFYGENKQKSFPYNIDFKYFILKKDNKKGIFGIDNKSIVPLEFDEVTMLSKDVIQVKKDGKMGYYNSQGKCFIPVHFFNIIKHEEENTRFFICYLKDSIYVYENENIKLQSTDYQRIEYIPEKSQYLNAFIITKDSTIVAKKEENEEKNAVHFNSININSCKTDAYHVSRKSKCGIIDLNGKVIIPIAYDKVEFIAKSNTFIVEKERKIAIFNEKGKQITDFLYELPKKDEWDFDEEIQTNESFLVLQKEGKMGVIDTNGNTIIPFEYQEINLINSHLFSAKKADKQCILSRKNEILYKEAEIMSFLNNYNQIEVKKKEEMGVIDSLGKMIIPCKYKELSEPSRYFLIGEKENGEKDFYNIINQKFLTLSVPKKRNKDHYSPEKIILYPYEFEYFHTPTCLIYVQNGKWKVCDSMGNVQMVLDADSVIATYYSDEFEMNTRPETEPQIWIFMKNQKKQFFDENMRAISLENKQLKKPETNDIPSYRKIGNNTNYFILEYANKKGIINLSPPYNINLYDDIIGHPRVGYRVIIKGEKEGLIDAENHFVFPLQDSLHFEASSSDVIFAPIVFHKKTNKQGVYLIHKKKMQLPLIYDSINVICSYKAHFKTEGSCCYKLQKGNVCALADFDGNFLTPFHYKKIENLAYSAVFLAYLDKKKTQFQLLDDKGKLISTLLFDSLVYRENGNTLYFVLAKNKQYYYFNAKGELLTSTEYIHDSYEMREEGGAKGLKNYFFISTPVKKAYVLTHSVGEKIWHIDGRSFHAKSSTKSNKFPLIGLINGKGKTILPSDYEEIRLYFSRSLIVSQKQKWGVYDTNEVLRVPILYDSISCLNEDYFILGNGQKYGVCNSNGKIIVPIQYDEISPMPHDAIKVRQNEKWGMVDFTGKMVIPIEHEALSDMTFGKIVAQKTGKCGALSNQNEWIIPPVHEGIEILFSNVFNVKDDCKYSLYDAKGIKKTKFEYDYIDRHCSQPFLRVGNNKFQGIIDTNGVEIIPCIYDGVKYFCDKFTYFKLEKGGLWSIVNEKNESIIPFQFDLNYSIKWYQNFEYFLLKKDNQKARGLFYKNGKMVLPMIYDRLHINREFNVLKGEINGSSYYFDLMGNKIDAPQGKKIAYSEFN